MSGDASKSPKCNRRTWLGGMAGVAFSVGASAQEAGGDREDAAVQKLLTLFDAADLPKPGVTRRGRFVAVGTAKRDFFNQVFRLAEDTAAGYTRFISGIRLPATFGQDRLILVLLANAGQYSRFTDQKRVRNEGGYYDIDSNWTVTFDHRGRTRSTRSDLERANQVTMIHEITHQLSFNTGLLSVDADIPMMVSEGLATMSEPSGAAVLPGFSEVNRPRIAVMAQIVKRTKGAWIRLEDLIKTDDPFDAPDDSTVQLAYAESWLFWDSVVRQSKLREKLGGYLGRVNKCTDPKQRVADFVASFGSIKSVENEMAANWNSLISG